MIECTICLRCNVSGWEYSRDIMDKEDWSAEGVISLTGEVEHKGFIDNMPFDIRLISGYHSLKFERSPDINVLELNEAMPEYDYPETLSALIPVTENKLEELKQSLFLLSKNRDMSLSVTLSVQNLYKAKGESECVTPIEGRKMEISSLNWNLSWKNEL